MKQQFEGLEVEVTETNDDKQWYMTVEDAAKGYGVDRTTIMTHLRNHKVEIRAGIEKGVENTNTLGGQQRKTVLYREGVIKLGFFIRSERAALFRQWATNLICQHLENEKTDIGRVLEQLGAFRNELSSKIDGFKDKLGSEIAGVKTSLETEIAGVKLVCGDLRDEVDELKDTLRIFITDTDETRIRVLLGKVKNKTGWDGRKIVGEVRKALNLASIYDPPHVRLVINALKNMLGSGLVVVQAEQPEQPTDQPH